MRSLNPGCALHADNMQLSAVNNVTSILRQVVQLGCPVMWLSLLFYILEDSGLDCSLPTQVMTLRLMTSSLPRSPLPSLLEQLVSLPTLLSCVGLTAHTMGTRVCCRK